MIVGRIIGWLLILAAIAVVGGDISGWFDTGTYRMRAAGEIWFRFDVDSLNAAQAGIQRYLLPELWDPVIVTVLTWPGWAVLGVPGIVLLWLCWHRRPRHHSNLS